MLLVPEVADPGKGHCQVAFVGSALDYAFFLEMGTSKMHARPFLRPTLAACRDAILQILATGKR